MTFYSIIITFYLSVLTLSHHYDFLSHNFNHLSHDNNFLYLNSDFYHIIITILIKIMTFYLIMLTFDVIVETFYLFIWFFSQNYDLIWAGKKFSTKSSFNFYLFQLAEMGFHTIQILFGILFYLFWIAGLKFLQLLDKTFLSVFF